MYNGYEGNQNEIKLRLSKARLLPSEAKGEVQK